MVIFSAHIFTIYLYLYRLTSRQKSRFIPLDFRHLSQLSKLLFTPNRHIHMIRMYTHTQPGKLRLPTLTAQNESLLVKKYVHTAIHMYPSTN